MYILLGAIHEVLPMPLARAPFLDTPFITYQVLSGDMK